jgi:D-alanyl-D-alanine carboxypeptidase
MKPCDDLFMALRAFVLAGLLVCYGLSVRAASSHPIQIIDTRVSSLTSAGKFSGALLLARDGVVLLRQGYGFANLAQQIPFTPETRHHVASISKMFTAMSVLKLRDQRRLKLHDSICSYLEDCPKIWRTIEIQHLIHHTSGISDYEEKLGLYSSAYLEFMTDENATATILLEARKQNLEFRPGTRFRYSNTGYVLLSSIVETVFGKPFNRAVHDLVLEPSGLKNTDMYEPGMTGISSGYTKHWKPIPELALTPPAGDAALVSTLDDLYRWSQIMDARGFAEVFKAGLGGYAMGWFVDRRFDQKRYVHTGELPGYRTVMVKYPSKNMTILLFSNQDAAPMESLTREISELLLKL